MKEMTILAMVMMNKTIRKAKQSQAHDCVCGGGGGGGGVREG